MRIAWNRAEIHKRLTLAIEALGLSRMPTNRELVSLPMGGRLANAIARDGGFDSWADEIGVARAEHDSRFGWEWESRFASECVARGFAVSSRDRVKAPVDMFVNRYGVDVKVANGAIYGGSLQWTWRIAKREHVADFYALFALRDRSEPNEYVLFIIPASEVSLTTVTVRDGGYGKRAKWLARWDLLA